MSLVRIQQLKQPKKSLIIGMIDCFYKERIYHSLIRFTRFTLFMRLNVRNKAKWSYDTTNQELTYASN
nr:hypothetical protein CFP56_27519 [Quercus suber]